MLVSICFTARFLDAHPPKISAAIRVLEVDAAAAVDAGLLLLPCAAGLETTEGVTNPEAGATEARETAPATARRLLTTTIVPFGLICCLSSSSFYGSALGSPTPSDFRSNRCRLSWLVRLERGAHQATNAGGQSDVRGGEMRKGGVGEVGHRRVGLTRGFNTV